MSTKDQISSEDQRIARELRGKRLICELVFDRGELDQWRQLLFPEGLLGRNIYPYLTAVVTVGTGIYDYNQGDFWSAFRILDTPVKKIIGANGLKIFWNNMNH